MISRRLIRIKIVQVLYSYFTNDKSSLDSAEKEMHLSIKKTYDLYHYFLLLLLNVADYAQERIDIAKEKRLPTFDDLHPNTRFVDNKVIHLIRNSGEFNKYISQNKISWTEHHEIIKNLHQKITESSYFEAYMKGIEPDFETQKKLFIDIYANEFEGWELLYQIVEELSIFWNDDIEFVISMIIKSIEKFREGDKEGKLMSLYKNDEDKEFGKVLLRKSILKHDQFRTIIDQYTKNWEIERIAVMDIIIMIAALTEITEFPSIPIKVTLNEYIDIARFYSTSKSNEFVNGILDKIVIDLKKEDKIVKTGRGLLND